jgi:hypothetical protein
VAIQYQSAASKKATYVVNFTYVLNGVNVTGNNLAVTVA